MKFILSFLIAVTTLSAIAQSNTSNSKRRPHANILPLDSSFIECIYEYKVYDPVLDETRADFKILAISRNLSMFSDYGTFQIDSIIPILYPYGVTNKEYHKIALTYNPSSEATIKDFASATMTTYDKVFINHYTYDEPLPSIKWVHGYDIMDICELKCRKATTSFRGRNWTAWYCPEIAIDNGPWKFGGLPGLILLVESDDKEHKFEAVTIRKEKNLMGLHQRLYEKITRERFNKELEDYNTHPAKYLSGNPLAPKDKEGNLAVSEFRRLFFNPIELE